MFLKIDGVDGESLDSTHAGEMEILSWSWGETNSGTFSSGGGGGAGKVNMQDFHFVINMGKHTPILMQLCAKGDHIPTGLLTCRKAGGDKMEFLKVEFNDLLISSYQTGNSQGMESPTDQCSFNYSKIKITYKEQKADGSLGGTIEKGYDLKTNTPI